MLCCLEPGLLPDILDPGLDDLDPGLELLLEHDLTGPGDAGVDCLDLVLISVSI